MKRKKQDILFILSIAVLLYIPIKIVILKPTLVYQFNGFTFVLALSGLGLIISLLLQVLDYNKEKRGRIRLARSTLVLLWGIPLFVSILFFGDGLDRYVLDWNDQGNFVSGNIILDDYEGILLGFMCGMPSFLITIFAYIIKRHLGGQGPHL